jgi:D-arabinose 1-dehydrogenase-like Zn-dependent alcohol dehydrogenase
MRHAAAACCQVIDMQYVNTAMGRMAAGDVKFRFVIDINKSLAL